MSTKRKQQQSSSSCGVDDKIMKMNSNKKTKFFRKGQTKRYIEAGQRGFLATTNFREKECVRECYNILNQYADELYGLDDFTKLKDAAQPKNHATGGNGTVHSGVDDKVTVKDVPSSDDENDEEEDIATTLENDIKASLVAGKSKDRRFQQVETGSSNCVFIRTTLVDPVDLAARIVKDLSVSHKAITRNVLRFIPVETICKANVTDIVNAAGPLFDKHFLNAPSTTFSVVYNKRCNETIKRDEIINELAQLVTLKNMTHKVDLKNAHYSIIVEVIKGLCCLSVVPEYMQMKKYNLTELGTSPPKPAEPVDAEVATPAPKPAEPFDAEVATLPSKPAEPVDAEVATPPKKSAEPVKAEVGNVAVLKPIVAE